MKRVIIRLITFTFNLIFFFALKKDNISIVIEILKNKK